ncbi:MAG: hypothetical protein ILA29_03495 [Prevotella sp.]|nr:hypothetical protein [Prevotella sp.]
MLILALGMGISAFAQFEAGKTYTIKNSKIEDGNGYIQDNGGTYAEVKLANANYYWTFEATGNPDCYHVKNAVTGRYLQGYENNSGTEIEMGNTGAEYYIKADATGSYEGKYRLAYTGNEPHDFSNGTLGCNWKGTDTDGTLQSFASVAGGNPRSAWIITQEDMPETFSITSGTTYTLENFAQSGFLKDERVGNLKASDTCTEYALWLFTSTGNDGCYNIMNVLTGNYIQSTTAREEKIPMGTEPVEIKAGNDKAKGINVYGFASTDQQDGNVDFSSATIGINWRNTDEKIAQGYNAEFGNNPRSFWKMTAVDVINLDENNEENANTITSNAGENKTTVVIRTMKSGTWNTIVVPFTLDEAAVKRNFGENTKVAKLDNETDGTLHFISATTLEAGKPYLIMPAIDAKTIVAYNKALTSGLTPAEGETYDYVGVYDKTTIGDNDYFLASGNTLKKNSNANGKLKPFRAYFRSKDTEAKALTGFDIDGETTGIIGIDGTVETNVKAYNLNGQKVNPNTLQKGIYIINGKKIINK